MVIIASDDRRMGNVPLGTNGTAREGESDWARPRTRNPFGWFTSCMFSILLLSAIEFPLSCSKWMSPFQQGSAKFVNFTKALNINLVECSPTLQKIQYNTLKCEDEPVDDGKRTVSKLCGAPVCWHASLEQVPSGCTRLFSFRTGCLINSFLKFIDLYSRMLILS